MTYMLTTDQLSELKERLQYVVEKTESAANATLDDSVSCLETIAQLKNASSDALENNESTTAALNNMEERLRDIVCAQEYQDLCAQTLNRAIALLNTLDGEIQQSASDDGVDSTNDTRVPASNEQSFGPAYNDQTADEAVGAQSDVDDLFEKHRIG